MSRVIFTYETWFKTGTYCLMHFTVAITVAYLLSGRWDIALSIGILEPLVQTGCFWLHENSWRKARAGYDAASVHASLQGELTPDAAAGA